MLAVRGPNGLSYESSKVWCRVRRHFGCKFTVLNDIRSRFVEVKQGVASINIVNLGNFVAPKFLGTC